MLKDLPFFGTTRVANKGVDVTLIVRPSHTAEAFSKAVSAIKKRKGDGRNWDYLVEFQPQRCNYMDFVIKCPKIAK